MRLLISSLRDRYSSATLTRSIIDCEESRLGRGETNANSAPSSSIIVRSTDEFDDQLSIVTVGEKIINQSDETDSISHRRAHFPIATLQPRSIIDCVIVRAEKLKFGETHSTNSLFHPRVHVVNATLTGSTIDSENSRLQQKKNSYRFKKNRTQRNTLDSAPLVYDSAEFDNRLWTGTVGSKKTPKINKLDDSCEPTQRTPRLLES